MGVIVVFICKVSELGAIVATHAILIHWPTYPAAAAWVADPKVGGLECPTPQALFTLGAKGRGLNLAKPLSFFSSSFLCCHLLNIFAPFWKFSF